MSNGSRLRWGLCSNEWYRVHENILESRSEEIFDLGIFIFLSKAMNTNGESGAKQTGFGKQRGKEVLALPGARAVGVTPVTRGTVWAMSAWALPPGTWALPPGTWSLHGNCSFSELFFWCWPLNWRHFSLLSFYFLSFEKSGRMLTCATIEFGSWTN